MVKAKLFRARYLLPIASDPIEDGALLVEAGRIVAVGPYAALRRRDAELVDCGDGVLLPPLVNAHCHLELTDFPQWAVACGLEAKPDSFVGWIQRLVRILHRLGSEPNPASIRHGLAQLLASGTGAVGDIVSWFPGAAVTQASPLHGRLFFESIGLTPERYQPQLEAGRAGIAALAAPQVGGLSPHAPYTVSAAHLRAVLATDLPLAIHCAEAPEETAFIRDAAGPLAEVLYPAAGWSELLPPPSGLSPVAWLDACGALTPRTLLIHGVQVDERDVALIARRGSCVVLCPRSNEWLGVGTAPAGLYRRHGVPLALGTDSLASNATLSLWDELVAARCAYPEMTPDELLTMATQGGAQALGVAMGTLEAGGDAHFQLVRLKDLPRPAELADYLCSVAGSVQVAGLWLDGHDVLAHLPQSDL